MACRPIPQPRYQTAVPVASVAPDPSALGHDAETAGPRLVAAARRGSIEQLDALAAALAGALHRLTRPLAIVACEACAGRTWTELGYARAEDYARERLGRTGRWLRELAALGRSTRTALDLVDALEGSDGKAPLGSVAAVAIARFDPPGDALPTWIALARAVSVRELRRHLRRARAAGSSRPVDAAGRPDDSLRPPDRIIEWIAGSVPELLAGPAYCELAAQPWNRRYLQSLAIDLAAPEGAGLDDAGGTPAAAPVVTAPSSAEDSQPDAGPCLPDDPRLDEDREPLLRLRLDLPAPVVAAFHEVRRLHERVVGQRTTTASFTDALVAEARAAGLAVRPDLDGAFDRLCAIQVIDAPEREAAWDRRRTARAADRAARPEGQNDPAAHPARPTQDPEDQPGPAAHPARPTQDPEDQPGPAAHPARPERRAQDPEGQPGPAAHPAHPGRPARQPEAATPPAQVASKRFPPAGPTASAPGDDAARLIERAGELADRAHALSLGGLDFSPTGPARRLQALVRLEQELRRVLGELLADLRARRAWHALGFADLRHYAEARLGMSRSAAEDAALLARALPSLPAVRDAWLSGRLTPAAALRVVRVLGAGRQPVAPELERDWAEHAATTTVKRLDDERALLRERRLLRDADPLVPVSDADWNAALARAPGASAARLHACAQLAAERSDDVVPLLLVLPFSRGADFLGALAAATRRVQTFSAAPLDPFDARWLGLVTLLTSYAASHDRHSGRAGVYARDGWRCRAPGCTSHANLEDHHVRYRSRSGDDSPDNRVTLCRFHHQRGEHGGTMRVVGRAPLELEFTLDGATYRNERRTGPANRDGSRR